MARHKHSKQLSQADIERFLADAERLHKTITRPLISPSSDHHRALVALNQTLLQTVKEVTGKSAPWVPWSTTGPVN
ncbi:MULTISPECIES: hypothetical protein [unclassified Mesorhizobium]|uniref:hypothetical protein n=1 Tax=unclassified Mesorhizobium TaxID=325217 RepID=UPI000FD89032|nr:MULTISPECIES: hypothetical protein [unclassified Mesorhizobium]TGQ29826.1 hypothetical protein EN859_032705 [Mesorhizobium sp. M00.F.Ca.ET.216.01.1.1]TIS55754.1 MAG: hypothetical protein E5W91_20310 [Mesorhizobium sp.]TIS89851.1 MAG: hypothetical protein E5W89_15310 [Mesorhizobium sp.]TJW03953.1 MAG: hypothetical protein E5W82_31370 [Mesorhizobium sp.]